MNAKSMLLAALLVSAAGPALAQANVVTAAGTVDTFDGTTISVKKADGGAVESFKLAPNFLVVQNKPATLADIKPSDFVASAAMMGMDHKLHSTELRIFPEAMRGVGEGQRPMNDPQNQTMTNATVTGTAIASGSNHLKVKFEGGESELVVDPGIPVTRIDVADKSQVKAGVKVALRGTRTADGASINRITIQ